MKCSRDEREGVSGGRRAREGLAGILQRSLLKCITRCLAMLKSSLPPTAQATTARTPPPAAARA